MKNLGTVEVGKVANLMRIDSNPLSNLSALQNPKIVCIKERKLDRKTLDNSENRVKNRYNLIASAARYIENLIIERETLKNNVFEIILQPTILL